MNNSEHPNLPPNMLVTALTKKEVANAFKISGKTLYRRLKAVGISITSDKNIYPEQLQLLFSKFGNPIK